MAGLPAFFQTTGTKTVLDGLTNFELGGHDEDDALEGLIGGDDDQGLEEGLGDGDETFGDDTFGDLKEDNLPEFFATPKKATAPSQSTSTPSSTSRSNVSTTPSSKLLNMLSTPQRSASQQQTASMQGLTSGMKTMGVMSSPPPGMPASAKKAAGVAGPPGLPSSTPAPANRVPPNTPAMSYAAAAAPGSPQPTPAKLATAQEFMKLVEKEDVASAVAAAASALALAAPPPIEKPRVSAFDVNIQPTFATLSGTEALNKPFPVQAAAISGKPDFGRGKLMSASDVRFVVSKVLQPLESSDPYSDDFYFLQYNIKKNIQAREQAAKEQRAPPAPLHVPLPAWKDTKERIKAQMDLTRKGFEDKVKEWEEKEQVLGHRIRPEVSKPREQLSLPSVHDMDFDLDDDDGEFKAPFSSRLWATRLAVQQGFEALYTVQELQHLMSSPVVANNPLAVEEIRHEMDDAIGLLSQALGIRHSLAGLQVGHEFSLDGRHIAAILQTSMGKKLLSRGLKLLAPNHRWTLVPVVLARIMVSNPATGATVSSSSGSSSSSTTGNNPVNENVLLERKLLKTIIEFLQYSYQHHKALQAGSRLNCGTTDPIVALQFTDDLLNNLRQCLKNILVIQLEKNQLRESLLSERTRAEIMNVVVEVGDQIYPVASPKLAEEWQQTRDAFMSCLEN